MKGEKDIALVAEEGASLSSGSMRLYGQLLPSPQGEGSGVRLVGCIDLYNYDPLNRRAAVGIMVANEHRRQGYALAMLKELEKLFSDQWPVTSDQWAAADGLRSTLATDHWPLTTLHCLYADIAASNTASLSLFAKAGYKECGRFEEWLLIGDKYIDAIRVQKILKGNPYGVNQPTP